jgi:hypothetical protein
MAQESERERERFDMKGGMSGAERKWSRGGEQEEV